MRTALYFMKKAFPGIGPASYDNPYLEGSMLENGFNPYQMGEAAGQQAGPDVAEGGDASAWDMAEGGANLASMFGPAGDLAATGVGAARGLTDEGEQNRIIEEAQQRSPAEHIGHSVATGLAPLPIAGDLISAFGGPTSVDAGKTIGTTGALLADKDTWKGLYSGATQALGIQQPEQQDYSALTNQPPPKYTQQQQRSVAPAPVKPLAPYIPPKPAQPAPAVPQPQPPAAGVQAQTPPLQ